MVGKHLISQLDDLHLRRKTFYFCVGSCKDFSLKMLLADRSYLALQMPCKNLKLNAKDGGFNHNLMCGGRESVFKRGIGCKTA
jgi:hypothetical protein